MTSCCQQNKSSMGEFLFTYAKWCSFWLVAKLNQGSTIISCDIQNFKQIIYNVWNIFNIPDRHYIVFFHHKFQVIICFIISFNILHFFFIKMFKIIALECKDILIITKSYRNIILMIWVSFYAYNKTLGSKSVRLYLKIINTFLCI